MKETVLKLVLEHASVTYFFLLRARTLSKRWRDALDENSRDNPWYRLDGVRSIEEVLSSMRKVSLRTIQQVALQPCRLWAEPLYDNDERRMITMNVCLVSNNPAYILDDREMRLLQNHLVDREFMFFDRVRFRHNPGQVIIPWQRIRVIHWNGTTGTIWVHADDATCKNIDQSLSMFFARVSAILNKNSISTGVSRQFVTPPIPHTGKFSYLVRSSENIFDQLTSRYAKSIQVHDLHCGRMCHVRIFETKWTRIDVKCHEHGDVLITGLSSNKQAYIDNVHGLVRELAAGALGMMFFEFI